MIFGLLWSAILLIEDPNEKSYLGHRMFFEHIRNSDECLSALNYSIILGSEGKNEAVLNHSKGDCHPTLPEDHGNNLNRTVVRSS
jgi:hypothetical protein